MANGDVAQKQESPGIDIRIPWSLIRKALPWIIGGSLLAGADVGLNRWLNFPTELAQMKQEVHDMHEDILLIKKVILKKAERP